MIREAIDRVVELAAPVTVEVDGKVYVNKGLELPPEPLAATLELSTLGSLAEYAHVNRDGLDLAKTVLHVASPTVVRLLGPLSGRRRLREELVRAKAAIPTPQLDRFLDREAFQIQLQAMFAAVGDRESLLTVIGNMEAGETRTVVDDGTSQEVAVRRNAASRVREVLKKVVDLAPYRTFVEIEQPVSPFVFRVQDDGEQIIVALFECDGGAWRLKALEDVANHLSELLDGLQPQPAVLY